MTPFMLFVCFILCTASATSPIRNETDDTVPDLKPVVTIPRRCPPNEVLKSKAPCPPDTCNMLYVSVLCIANQTEYVVCTCKEGYLRTNSTPSGVCVPQDRCLPPECADDPNAIRGCGNRCGKTCADYNDTNIVCKEDVCNLYGCECKEGYVYDKNVNKCVEPKQCTKQCTKPHERYSACLLGECVAKSCDQLGYPIACSSLAISGSCKGGCICEEGYVKDRNGDCIEKNKCPSTQCNKPNERYSNCLLGECVPKRCDDVGYPVACPDIIGPCAGGCTCIEGYVRDYKGNCIDMKKCPSCGGDYNAVSGCGNPCGKTCASLYTNSSDLICPQYCEYNGCDCKPGYRLLNADNADTKKCVPERECPKPPQQCDKNEQYYCGTSCPEATCANPTPPKCVNKKCKLACFCKKGFVRDAKNKCIPVGKCPSEPKCKGPNEIYINCPAGQCNPKTCQDLITTPPCPRVIPPCPGGCVCKEGYLRAANGTCIKKEQCPSTQCNKPNERYSNCLLGECVPKRCDDVGYPVACPDIIGPCAGGCTCIEGYVRDYKGNCIDMKKCPSCGGDYNAVSGCGNPCGKTCASLYTNSSDLICPQYCEYNGCDCKPGYRLLNADNADTKKCVPERECPKPPQQCDKNEQYYCGTSCPEATCANPTPPKCVNKKCKLACFCKKGFVRDAKNKCIPVGKCPSEPKCKGPNEIYINCPAGQCNPKTCQDLITTPPCPRVIPPCPGGCVCKEGYLRAANGTCIKKEQCPSTQCNKPNERYSNCLLGECVPKRCDDVGYPVACPDIIGPCAGGCTCIEGYVKDYKGNCIDMKKCPSCGGDRNAVSGCGNPCGKTCASLYTNSSDLICPQYCEYNGCDCKPGYRLLNADNADTKKCVPERECPKPPQQCDKNEQYYCGTSCPEATCANPTPPKCVNKKCKLACFCKKGFVRDAKNKCIPVGKCQPECKGPNERYINCPAGQCNPKTCQDLITPRPCPRIRPPCPGGCVCIAGYLRNSKGKCVKKEMCPQFSCTTNQTYVSCNIKCPDKHCPKDDQPQPICDPPRDCPPGCTCKINYRYDQSGKCILASECPPVNCTGKNTEWNSCPSACLAEQCEDADSPPAVCNTLLLNCQPRCVCKPGHFKNSDGVCIPAKECPSVCKDPNASWKDYKDACPATCQNTRPGCVNKMCSPGCQCNDGYVLSKPGGKCVKIETCAVYAECGANQTFVPCTFKCPQVMCPKSDRTILCKPPRDCPGGCGCKPYYRYNATGDCVKASDCPSVKCTRSNEEFACQRVYAWERCEDRYNSPPFNPGHPDDCTPKCVCKEGFWRDNANKCVPADQCQTDVVTTPKPEPQKCPENEVLKKRFSCPPDTCDSLYLSFLCVAEQNETLVCTCKDGYLRTNASGVCVPQDRCLPPECANDPNAIRGCGNRCKKTCADYNDTSKVCDKRVCKLFGCDCKDGFVYDETKNICVEPNQCTPQCKGPYEKYIDCPAGQCNPKTCKDLITPPGCPRIRPPCPGGCVCQDGYLRNSTGICIKKEQCPSVCEDPNASWKDCKDACPGTCQNTRPICVNNKLCTPGCQCNDGYVLSKTGGKCVLIETCADYAECGANQTFVSCTHRCPQVMCPESDQIILCKPPRDCPGGCGCKPNYRYNADGECIKGSDCPPVECTRPNEEWAPCRSEYDWERCDDRFNSPPIVSGDGEDCNPRCVCKKGFWRNNAGECVTESECPAIA